jgi:hypothetical protein
MNHTFDLPVHYKGEIVYFSSQLIQQGYLHKFRIDVHGQVIYFEPDEERSYRAVLNEADVQIHKTLEIDLLKSIAEAIIAVTR